MKELKAVEILQNKKEWIETIIDRRTLAEEQLLEATTEIKEIDEALAELQELTQEKSCKGCVEEYRKKSGLENYKNFGLEKSILVFPCNACQRMATDHYTPKR